MSEKISICPNSLYYYSLKQFVREMDLTVKNLDKMCHLRLLPPAILSDIYREVSLKLLQLETFLDRSQLQQIENETKHSIWHQKTFIFLYNKINLDLCCCSMDVVAMKEKKKNEKKTLRDGKRRLKNKKDGKDPEESVARVCCLFIPLFSSLFVQMAENSRLQDVLLAELSDVNLFCKLIKYPAIRDNMLKTFKVRVLLCKSADLDSHSCVFYIVATFRARRAHSKTF